MGSRALTIGLVVSLALNAFLAAFALALVAAPGLVARRASTPVLRQAARQLDPEHRAAFTTLLRSDGRRLRPQNQGARMLRREVWADLQAPAFDPAAARTRLAEARDLNAHARAVVEDDVIDFAATLPADQRAALGRALLRLTPPVRNPAALRGSVSAPAPAPAPASPGPGSSPAPRNPE